MSLVKSERLLYCNAEGKKQLTGMVVSRSPTQQGGSRRLKLNKPRGLSCISVPPAGPPAFILCTGTTYNRAAGEANLTPGIRLARRFSQGA